MDALLGRQGALGADLDATGEVGPAGGDEPRGRLAGACSAGHPAQVDRHPATWCRHTHQMSRREWFGRLMDRIADDDAWSRTFLGVLLCVVVTVALWIATGIFWPLRP